MVATYENANLVKEFSPVLISAYEGHIVSEVDYRKEAKVVYNLNLKSWEISHGKCSDNKSNPL